MDRNPPGSIRNPTSAWRATKTSLTLSRGRDDNTTVSRAAAAAPVDRHARGGERRCRCARRDTRDTHQFSRRAAGGGLDESGPTRSSTPLQGRQCLADEGRARPDRGVRRPGLGRRSDHRHRLRPRRQRAAADAERQGRLRRALRLLQQPQTPDGSVEHTGDNLTGEGEGDDEQIKVNLAGRARPTSTRSSSRSRSTTPRTARQSFGQVRNAFIRVVNQADGTEIARYDLSEDASTETAMVFGELYRNGAEWKFRAVGQGYASGLRGHRPGLRRQSLSVRKTTVLICWRHDHPQRISFEPRAETRILLDDEVNRTCNS